MNESAPQFDRPRRQMVDEQLRQRGIGDRRVLQAMSRVPREQFVDPATIGQAYEDRALPIECGQTISQPLIVALMTEALQLTSEQRVLEVGTGSGYQTAVLAELAAEVYSIERHAKLAQRARQRLERAGYKNIQLRIGDGTLGWPEAAPFDRIIVTAAAAHPPEPLWNQLADGGLMVIPIGSAQMQTLQRLRRVKDRHEIEDLTACRFVPLLGAEGGQMEVMNDE